MEIQLMIERRRKTMKQWTKPDIAITYLHSEDVIRTSALNHVISGKGDALDWSGQYYDESEIFYE